MHVDEEEAGRLLAQAAGEPAVIALERERGRRGGCLVAGRGSPRKHPASTRPAAATEMFTDPVPEARRMGHLL